MHTISEKKLREFSTRHPEAEEPLRAWARVASKASWAKPSEITDTYPFVSQVGKFTVFNVGGNKYQIVCVVHFNRQKLFIRHVMTHEEYDRRAWARD